MHELSIALSLIELAEEEAARIEGHGVVQALHLRLGPLSGVVREALEFSFEVAIRGTSLEGARLLVQDVPVAIRCGGCDAEVELPRPFPLQCPRCLAPATDVVRGRECLLVALEITDHAAPDR